MMSKKSRTVVRKRRGKSTDGRVTIDRIAVVTLPKVAADAGKYDYTYFNQYPVSDIVSLFTDYKIQSVRYTFRLVSQPNNNSNFPTLTIAPQHSNYLGTSLGSISEIQQLQDVVSHQFGPSNLVFTKVFKPYVNALVSAANGDMPIASPFLSTASGAVIHATAAYWIQRYNSPTDNSHTIELEYRVRMTARRSR